MPKRIIGPSHYSATGRVSSHKNGLSRDAESGLEQDFLVLLEFDNQVARYAVQPITIQWETKEGQLRKYTPDILVLYHTKMVDSLPIFPPTIFEVKPRKILKRDWEVFKPKFKAAMAWARENGFRFKLITDEQIWTPYLENVRFLTRYRENSSTKNEVFDRSRHIALREALRKLELATPQSLLSFLTESRQFRLELIPMIWQLMHSGVIAADLTKPLNMNTAIWLKKQVR